MKSIRLSVLIISMVLLIALVSGCGPKSPSRPIMKGYQALQNQPVKEGYDRLTICRPLKFVSGGVYSAFLINNTPAVTFRSGCACFDVKPGKHFIEAKITNYDASKWGKGIIVDTKKQTPSIVVFNGPSRKYSVKPDFPIQKMRFYSPENPVINKTYVTEQDKTAIAEIKVQTEKKNSTITGYKKSIESYLSTKDYTGLKSYINNNPKAAYYIPDYKIRLLFTGPAKLQVGDLINYKKKKISDVLLVAKIKSSKTPYKIFSMEEIAMLQEYNISDTVIAAMIEVTTEIEKEMARDEKQRKFLDAQKAFTDQQQSVTGTQNNSGLAGEVGKAVGKEVGKKVIKSLLNNLF